MNKIKVIVGATATGKTKRAIEFAKTFDGEIINCDSMQIYKDLNILTAFPSSTEMSEIKHKLFGYLDYTQKTSAVDWAKLASSEIKQTLAIGKTPVIVGGTGLYIKTLVDGISPLPEISPNIRKCAHELANQNFDELCKQVYQFDGELENLMPKSMHHQLIRAYEIMKETGKSIKEFWALPKIKFIANVVFEFEVLNCERKELYERIATRFDDMLKNGAITEVQSLLVKINNRNRQVVFEQYPIFRTIGAKEITLFLDGVYSFDEMHKIAIKNSRHYAKRQITWFKNQL